ncbi:MAG: YwaF family protein [Candidatus Marinimicrobia bacterium]|nr:YwaF family protein [Candidatus Neomarinimicrobiota bacterium]
MVFFSFQRGIEDNLVSIILPYVVWSVIVFLIIKYNTLIRLSKRENVLRYSLALFAATLEIIFYVWQLIRTNFDMMDFLFKETMIPLHVCAMALWFSVYSALTLNRKIFAIGLFLAMTGTPITIIAGSVDYSLDRFRYWHFYLVHIFSFSIFIYLFFVNQLEIRCDDFKLAVRYLALMAFCVALPLNIIFGSNFMYLYNAYDSPIENFPKIWTIFIMSGVAIGFFFIVNKIFLYLNKIKIH